MMIMMICILECRGDTKLDASSANFLPWRCDDYMFRPSCCVPLALRMQSEKTSKITSWSVLH